MPSCYEKEVYETPFRRFGKTSAIRQQERYSNGWMYMLCLFIASNFVCSILIHKFCLVNIFL